MGSAVKARVGSCVMCIGRELSNNSIGISCCSFPDFFFLPKECCLLPLHLLTVFCEEKPQCKSVAQKKNLCQTITWRDWMVGISFCFPPLVIAGLLQAAGTDWRYDGPPAEGSPDAWLFKDRGRKAPGKALSVRGLLPRCSTAVPGTAWKWHCTDQGLLGL